MAARPNVFSIPAGIPFARALSLGIVARACGDPLALADALVLVPTRRAVRTLRDALAEALGGAALLPRIRPLGDAGEDDGFDAADDLGEVTPIHPLRRRLLLAQLVQQWKQSTGARLPFAQAMNHAGELARFLDEATTQGADLSRLASLVPEAFAGHWNEIARFLSIVSEQWPQILEAEGRIDPATYRDRALQSLAASLRDHPPEAPVIAAGSTGSIPATAELLRIIAHLPNGAVVLPGLDMHLDPAGWDKIEEGHAQFGLRQLIGHIGIARQDVAPWPSSAEIYDHREARTRFLSEALRPPPTTDSWRALVEGPRTPFTHALDGMALIEAATPREEALAIAIALRQSLEQPGRTAALVTPDRGLARRVAAELSRWNIVIDDSAGLPLARTPPGAFLSLLAQAAAEDFAPVPLLSLLKHPLASGGMYPVRFRRLVREMELSVLRGLRPDPGLAGIAGRLAARDAPAHLRDWFAQLETILEPFSRAIQTRGATLAALARAHAETAELLGATDSDKGASALWCGEAGEAAAALISELIHEGADVELADAAEYPEIFRDLAEARAVRPRRDRHPRLAILGPLEARLQDFDLIILGGLNEGAWPAEAATDPWLSRPMRKKIGLEPPERRIGLAAHDFAALASSRNVLLTRALKDNGAPTVPSRWLLRILQLANGLGLNAQLASGGELLQWARRIDESEAEPRAMRPSPKPPLHARPRTLRVTEIETWLRDPYAIYARHVLRLRILDPLDQEPGPAERGTAVHLALERFLAVYPDRLPEDALTRLLDLASAAFREKGASRAVLSLWLPRFARAARWFIDYEQERRAAVQRTIVEVKGSLEIPAANGPFTLVGRADRIDLWPDGSASILDYKTGSVPSDKQIRKLIAPQLPLEAAMLKTGAFADVKPLSVRELIHVQLKGEEGNEGRECIAPVDGDAIATEALAKLQGMIREFDRESRGYTSRRMPFMVRDAGDYDHLARVAEWMRESEAGS